MRIAQLFQQKKLVFSFEVFPPKKDSSIHTIYNTLAELTELHPDFISVTYGAGGKMQDRSTSEIASFIKREYGIPALAHLTCINSTKEELSVKLEDLHSCGIENILALRGDRNPDIPGAGCFTHATELVEYIGKQYDFNIAGACYPEGHPESPGVERDIEVAKRKQRIGVSHFISQLFFDNNDFYNYMYRLRDAGVTVPVQAGIMPVVNKNSINRIVTLCGASLPKKFVKILHRYGDDKEALFEAGIAYATDQIIDLISNSVQGIHLYTMNQPAVARRILANVKNIIRCVNYTN